jgi:heme/copper-type cytochrome/quinol oxidase subunit 2
MCLWPLIILLFCVLRVFPGLTVKVIGRQWYWSYEMHDHLQQKLLDPDRLVAIAEKSVLKS